MGGQATGGGDFWSELSSTNANLSMLQEQIQAVRSAHQQSLVRTRHCSPSPRVALTPSPLPTRKLPHEPTN